MIQDPGLAILVVEDDEATAELERRTLARAGFEITVAGNVGEALALLKHRGFDAILLDYNLPDGEPWAIVERARALSPRVPVVLITSAGSEPIVAEALQRGVGDYIRKSPSYLDRLGDVVKRAASMAHAEEALRHSGVLFQLIADHGDDMIVTLDTTGRVRYVSAASRRLLGYEMADLIGTQVQDLVHPDENAASIFGLTPTAGDAARCEVHQLRHREGHYIWVESKLQRVRDANGGGITEIIGITRDATARIAAQHRIEAALREKTALLSEVHHRVMNNLQIISGLLKLQRDHSGQAEVHAALEESESRIKTMVLIHQCLYEQKNFARLDLAAYLQQLAQLVQDTHQGVQRQIQLQVVGPAAPVWLPFNQAVPCGLLINELLTNAYKHAFPDGRRGRIGLEIFSDEGNALQLTLTDDGVGLPAGLSLQQPQTLGLQVAGIMVKQLDGHWRVESNVQGARFELHFLARDAGPRTML